MKKTALLIALVLAVVAVQSCVQPKSIYQQQKLLRHVVMFKFTSTATLALVQDIENTFKALALKVPSVKGFEWGTNNSPEGFIPDADWFKFFEVNVMSGVRLSKAFMPQMLQQNWGRIIFISSESGVLTPEEMIHYGTTKTAQLAVSRGLAELTKGTAVTVNAVLPGPTWSEGASGFVENLATSLQQPVKEVAASFFKEARPTSLLQRFATVDEVASMVTYLVSPLSSATNGAAIRVDGGVVKHIL